MRCCAAMSFVGSRSSALGAKDGGIGGSTWARASLKDGRASQRSNTPDCSSHTYPESEGKH